jgi:hypothetical protein
MRRMMVAVIAAITLVWSAVPAMATLTPVKVIGGPANQYWGSSNGTYVAWTRQVDSRDTAYVKELPSGTPERVARQGTRGGQASFVGSSNVLVYTESSPGTKGDIYFYDVSTGTRTEAPAAVNQPQTWEWGPMASDNYLLFMRGTRLLLYDSNSGVMTTLETGTSKSYGPLFAGTTYAAWFVCGSVACAIHYWSATGGEQVQPTVQGRSQYSATIDEATGQIYFARSGRTVYPVCKGHTIRRADLGSSTSTILATLPPGISVGLGHMSLATNSVTSHQDLYFDHWSCTRETGDIYALEGVDTV